jgi:predicted pyridoxine 5'-phosphate oxidase superfamily flavin-nucleotide-binding protein
MGNSSGHRIETVAQLQALIGEPNPMTPKKLCSALDDAAIDFIGRSPFLVLATADAQGNEDASPKGDGPGFVAVEDAQTLLIPERKGNRLMFSLGTFWPIRRLELFFSCLARTRPFASTGPQR